MSEDVKVPRPKPTTISGAAMERITNTIEADPSVYVAFVAVRTQDGAVSWAVFGDEQEGLEVARITLSLGAEGQASVDRSTKRLRSLLRLEAFGRHVGFTLRVVGLGACLGIWFPGPVREAAVGTLEAIGIASIALLTLFTYASSKARGVKEEDQDPS